MNIMRCIVLMLLSSMARSDDSWPVSIPECGARLERRTVEADLLLVRTDCPVSLQSLAQLLEVGLDHMLSGTAPALRSIYLGRVMDYPEWSRALAQAASQSPDWNSRRGHPRKRSENDNFRVTKLLNGPAYPQNLKPVFSRYGLIACISSVEKVLIFEAKELFPQASKTTRAIPAAARLPADAQVWLKLFPMPLECTEQ